MAEASEKKSVHVIFVTRPDGEEAEGFYIKTLASVVGSEAAAKEALIYTYTRCNGFAAKLTSKEVEEISKQPCFSFMMPNTMYELLDKPGGAGHMGLT